MTILQPWWERFPQVLQEEEADLERLAGRPAKLNDGLLRSAAVRQYDLPYDRAPWGGGVGPIRM